VKNTENTCALELPDDAMRQYIDASAAFSAWEQASAEAAQVRGGMYWHKAPSPGPDQSYLVRTSRTGGEKSLGRAPPRPKGFTRHSSTGKAPPRRGWPASGTQWPSTEG
jgi:hypothetical protein